MASLLNMSGRGLITPPQERFTLLYHWEASDELVNNKWVDRVQGVPFTKVGNPQYEDGMWSCDKSNYFNNNSLNIGITKIILPERWRFEAEVLISEVLNNKYFIDFGSTGYFNHSFGFGFKIQNNKPLYHCNYKPTSNQDTVSAINAAGIEFPSSSLDAQKTFIAGVEKIDITYSKFYIELDGVKHYGEPHIPGAYDGNWNNVSAVIGGAINSSYSQPSKIKSVKFFSDNRQ